MRKYVCTCRHQQPQCYRALFIRRWVGWGRGWGEKHVGRRKRHPSALAAWLTPVSGGISSRQKTRLCAISGTRVSETFPGDTAMGRGDARGVRGRRLGAAAEYCELLMKFGCSHSEVQACIEDTILRYHTAIGHQVQFTYSPFHTNSIPWKIAVLFSETNAMDVIQVQQYHGSFRMSHQCLPFSAAP